METNGVYTRKQTRLPYTLYLMDTVCVCVQWKFEQGTEFEWSYRKAFFTGVKFRKLR